MPTWLPAACKTKFGLTLIVPESALFTLKYVALEGMPVVLPPLQEEVDGGTLQLQVQVVLEPRSTGEPQDMAADTALHSPLECA